MLLQLVTSGIYRLQYNETLAPVKDHPELDSKSIALGKQLGIEIAQKVIAQAKADQSQALGRYNWHNINFTVSLLQKKESLESNSPIQWKDNHKVEICLPEKRSEDQKAEKTLFDAVVDVAAEQFKNNFEEFKKATQEYEFFCYGNIDSSVESQTIINNIALKVWKEEKRVPENKKRVPENGIPSELLMNIFWGVSVIAIGLWLVRR